METPSPRPELVITGHSNAITSIAFSHDGKSLVSGSFDRTVIVWDVESGKMRRLFSMPYPVHDIAVSSSGLLAASYDNRLWDITTGQIVRRTREHTPPLAFAPNGKMLAEARFHSDSDEWSIVLSDVRTGRTSHTFSCGNQPPADIVFSSDGTRIAVKGGDYQDDTLSGLGICYDLPTRTSRRMPWKSWGFLVGSTVDPHLRMLSVSGDGSTVGNAETGAIIQRFAVAPYNSLESAAVSSDGRWVATGGNKGQVAVWSLASGACVWSASAHKGWVRTLAFTPDNKSLASAGEDHKIHLRDVANGEIRRSFPGRTTSVESVSFISEGSELLASYQDDRIRRWHIPTGTLQQTMEGTGAALAQDWQFVPHGSEVAQPEHEPTLDWDAVSKLPGGAVACLPDTWYNVSIANCSPDGSLLITRAQKGSLVVWERSTRTLRCILQDVSRFYGTLAFSPDGSTLASVGANDCSIQLWDLQNGALLHILSAEAPPLDGVRTLAFSSDSKRLASGDETSAIRLWNVAEGTLLRSMKAPAGYINALAFAPKGKTLAVGAEDDYEIWLWPLARNAKTVRLIGHTNGLRSLAYSPDGTRIASGSADNTVRLWDAQEGTLLLTLLALPDENWIAYTPEGYYHSSEGAEPFLSWRVGNEILPPETFTAEFHRPQKISGVS